MSAEGKPGGVLVVSDYPGDEEDRRGRPMVGGAGTKILRPILRQWWKGPVALDNALRCRVGARKVNESHLKKCRGYLAQTIAEVKPQRIVALGTYAIKSIVGEAVPPLSCRRGFAWLSDRTPVFLGMNPAAASRNRFVRDWFESDLKWALTTDVAALRDTIPWDACVNVVRTIDDALVAEEEARAATRWIAYDAETAGKLFERGGKKEPAFRVLCVSFVADNSEEVWLWDDVALARPELFEVLKRVMEDRTIGKCGQNEKYDHHCMRALGINVRGVRCDTRLIRKIVEPDANAKLEVMQAFVGMVGGKREMANELAYVIKRARQQPTKGEPDRGTYDDLVEEFGDERMDLVAAIREGLGEPKTYAYGLARPEIRHRYNGIDSLSTARLGVLFEDQWQHEPRELRSVWDDLVLPLSLAVQQVEEWGMAIDRAAIDAFQTVTMLKHQEARARIAQVATSVGFSDFNAASTAHLRTLLFDKLKLRPPKVTATGLPSTDVASLEVLTAQHHVVADIMSYRKIGKHRGTYADPLLLHVRSDGRVHPSIKLDGARSGRPSCENPNLFNIPRADTPHGKMARDCFCAPRGRKLVEFDYSQLELRVACMESGDPVMLELFKSGVDFHAGTAAKVLRIPIEQVTKPERSKAKGVNFGTLYGMGPFALAKRIGCTPEEAEKMQNDIMGSFRLLDAYCKERLREARRTGSVFTTWNGRKFRRRPLWRVADADSETRSVAEHGAWNTPIQGKASDFCLFSLVEVVRWILEEGIEDLVKLVITVYDSLMLEVADEMIDEVFDVVPEIMLAHNSHGVPVVVDGAIGQAWGSLEKAGSFSNMAKAA